MTLPEMLYHIHKVVRRGCFSDIVEQTGVSATTIWHWRNTPPDKPSLLVFTRLARYCGLNPTLEEMENLL